MIRLVTALARFALKTDAGFILGRLALVIPLIAVSQSGVSDEAYAVFAAHYHEALILSLILLVGANEAYLVRRPPAGQRGFWHILVLGIGACGALFLINAGGLTDFGGGLLFFLFFYRTLYLYFITVSREDLPLYCGLSLCLLTTAALLLWEGAPALWTLTPLVIGFVVGAARLDLLSHLGGAVRSYPEFLSSNAPYSLNQLVGAAYVQGALVVYALIAAGAVYLQATQYVYLMSFAVIVTQVLYRIFLIKIAKDGGGLLWGPQSILQIGTGLGLGAVLSVFASEIELLVFGRAVIPDMAAWLFVPTMLLVALQNITAAYLVGSGHVRQQFLVSVGTASGLVFLIVGLHETGVEALTLPVAILIAMTGGVAARLVLAARVRRVSRTE